MAGPTDHCILCRYWAVAIPALLVVAILAFLAAYWGVNLTLTAPLDDLRAIRGTS